MFFKKSQQSEDIKKPEETKTSLKDFIAPSAIKIESDHLELSGNFLRTFFVFSYPRFLSSGWFSPVINLDRIFDIAIYIHPSDTSLVLKQLRKKVAQVQSELMEREEKGLVRDPALETAHQDLEDLRDQLMQATEKFFRFGIYLTIYEDSLEELNKAEAEIRTILDARIIYTKNALFQQDAGFNSTLPLLLDRLQIHTAMNTSPISSVFPFVSADLSDNKGILYGINRHNNSLIIFDRFSLENGNMVIFAKSGSGKSYTAKLQVLRSLMMDTDVIIIDPENEYQYLADTIGGTFIKISLTSKHHLNPLDLPIPLKDESPADVLRSNILNLIGLMKLMLGDLTQEEIAIIEKAITQTYTSRDITEYSDFSKITPPLLSDLQTVLSGMKGAESLSLKLAKYTEGIYSGFLNNPTNVDMSNRLVVFSIRDLETELRPIAMYVIMKYIWNAIRAVAKKRILLIDEAWIMMKHEDAAEFLFGIAKRCRKYYLGLTTITQDISDFMTSKYGKPIVTNSSIQLLLKQSTATADVVKETFHLTDEEKFLLLESGVGEGIFIAGMKRAAIKVMASYTEDQIVTSNPAQLLEIEKAKRELGT